MEVIQSKLKENLPLEELLGALKKGVLVDGNKLLWLDDENRMCIELFARALTVVWGTTPEYWTYKVAQLSGGECIEVAVLLNVCWLDVEGHLDANMLSPCAEYEVLFDVTMAPKGYGFVHPLKFTLTIPDGRKIESEKRITEAGNEISIGKFTSPTPNTNRNSKIGFRMHEYNSQWKRGLIVRGVIFRPVNYDVYIS